MDKSRIWPAGAQTAGAYFKLHEATESITTFNISPTPSQDYPQQYVSIKCLFLHIGEDIQQSSNEV